MNFLKEYGWFIFIFITCLIICLICILAASGVFSDNISGIEKTLAICGACASAAGAGVTIFMLYLDRKQKRQNEYWK